MSSRKLIITSTIFILFLSSLGYFTLADPTADDSSTPTQPNFKRAAIVNQLSTGMPNQTFVNEATSILEEANYQVDYYPAEEITVNFYKKLPKKSYDIIIFRVHSSQSDFGDNPVVLFTSEKYEVGKYRFAQLADNLKKVYFKFEEEDYFGVTPGFIRGLDGDFDNATILHMGCEGLKQDNMARAFTEDKGAKVFLSWTGPVTPDHSDSAAIISLKGLVNQKMTIERAIQTTYGEIGADPVYKSTLEYYPSHADYKRID